MLTKAIIQGMKEDELSREVIIPLLTAMGFHDVFYFHGGAGEQGKDVVCWNQDELQARRNYALVIKASTISGQARSGKGTAGEVATQIQQALGSDYLDPTTSEPQSVHTCWVVTNQQISKEAETSIKSIIKTSNHDRNIRFVNGDKLWELVEKHLASETLMGKFLMIQKELSGIDTHYQPVIQLSGDEMQIGLREKFRGAAEEKPLKLNFSFQFPETPEGQAAKNALKQHFTTGAPVRISPEYIHSVEYPEIIKSLFGTDLIQSPSLEISPLSNKRHFIVRIEIKCDDGETFTFDQVDFQVEQSGTEEATLEGVNPGSLVKIKMILNVPERLAKLTFSWHLPNHSYSCMQLLQISEFQNCFSKPFNMRIISKENGLEAFAQRSEVGISSPPPNFYLEMLRVLLKLQQKSSNLIMIPIREFTDEEIKVINELIHIVRDGKIKGRWTEFKIKLIDFSQDALDALSERPLTFRFEAEEVENIFGVELPLGVSELVMRNGVFANLDEIREAYGSGNRDIEAHIVAVDKEGEFEKTYRNFIKKGDDNNLQNSE